jgi:hypothetical protein
VEEENDDEERKREKVEEETQTHSGLKQVNRLLLGSGICCRYEDVDGPATRQTTEDSVSKKN